MTPREVYDYFGSTYQFRKVTGMSTSSLSNWKRDGRVPISSQVFLEAVTEGKLKVDYKDLVKKKREDFECLGKSHK